jgi:hypothetical protein
LLSLVLLFTVPPNQRITVVWFAALTIAVGASLWFVRGTANDNKPTIDRNGAPIPARLE